jgi:putative membrane protein
MTRKMGGVLVLVVALVHVVISIVEIFFWNNPHVHGRLEFSSEQAKIVAPIVANAGLYNGFIAAGLVWGLVAREAGTSIKIFFLVCVIIAGIFGAMTLKPTTLVLQTLPGLAALVVVWVSTVPKSRTVDVLPERSQQ